MTYDCGGLWWAWLATLVVIALLAVGFGWLMRVEQERYARDIDAARKALWLQQHDGEWEAIQAQFEEESG
jgi:hypothetical protein